MKERLVKVEKWADENGMIFDPDKFKAIHFSRKKTLLNPNIKLPPFSSLRSNIAEQIIRPVGRKVL